MPPKKTIPLILASASPRRLSLLEQIGITPHQIISPDVDEAELKHEKPRAYSQRVAFLKAQSCLKHIRPLSENALVLAADTIICTAQRFFHKTDDISKARTYLEYLSGRRHRAISTVALYKLAYLTKDPVLTPISSRTVQTVIAFNRLSDSQISHYLTTEEWKGKAGAYAVQGYAASFVKFISGSYSNIVGLPLFETAQLLRGLGCLP